ncbi:MAG: glycosyltransferase family 2 protein [Candidatus Aenigmatarchaeota archaeon]|nr:MAG: glycosyltransferase family 2 protein [Candidatus Aenigmarchaeota archaeon]
MRQLRNYLVITPCKNEGQNLPNLVESVASQTIRPVLWVIVDDGSTDDTPEILKKAMEKYRWIKSIRLGENRKRDLGLHLASVIKKGFDFAIEYCLKNKINYNYLGNLDADLILEPTFYENLIKEFEKDPKLGIASGGTRHIIGNRIVYAKMNPDEPSGGHMLIRKECFEDCGGIPISYACDSVLKAKARLRGWKTRRFDNYLATEIRDVNSAEGYWRGFMHKGRVSYYLYLHPFHVLVRTLVYSCKRPHYTGLAYMLGYLSSFINKEEKINDEEIKQYFQNKWKKYLKLRNKTS